MHPREPAAAGSAPRSNGIFVIFITFSKRLRHHVRVEERNNPMSSKSAKYIDQSVGVLVVAIAAALFVAPVAAILSSALIGLV